MFKWDNVELDYENWSTLKSSFSPDHMLKEVIKFMKFDGLVTDDKQPPLPDATENIPMDVTEVNTDLGSLIYNFDFF